MASGPAQSPCGQQETELAVASIIEHDYTNMETNTNENLKRKYENIDHSESDTTLALPTNTENSTNINITLPITHDQTTTNTTPVRLYKNYNNGPYEVIVKDKNHQKINPFTIGKILKSHSMEIDFIKRAGKNIVITCKSYLDANNIVLSEHLKQFSCFIPTLRIHTVGVAYIETGITDEEILMEANCKENYPIIQVQRIKRSVNKILTDTNFVKITFDSDRLPSDIYLNYVKTQITPYMIPVKQCFRCFAYGHVMKSPCHKSRICRDCGDNFHSGECTSPKKCIHCQSNHSSNSRQCPEYQRQKNIKDRMSLYREDYFTASKFYPITYKKTYRKHNLTQTYVEVLKYGETESDFPQLPTRPHTSNRPRPNYNIGKSNPNITTSNRFQTLNNMNEEEEDNFELSGRPNIIYNRVHHTLNTKPIYRDTRRTNQYSNRTVNLNTKTETQAQIVPTQDQTKTIKINDQETERLKLLLQEKIKEIRTKIQNSSNITTKKQIDEFLAQYLSNGEKLSPTGTKHVPDKQPRINNNNNLKNNTSSIKNNGPGNSFRNK